MDLLTNPWVIIVIVLSVVIGNIAALKYTANMKFGQSEKKPQSDSDDQNDESEESKKDAP